MKPTSLTNRRGARSLAFVFCGVCIAGPWARDAFAQEFLIDFGPANLLTGPATTTSPDANGNTWNNLTPGQTTRLLDTSGTAASSTSPLGIRLDALTTFGTSIFDGEGLTTPSVAAFGSLAVESATADYAFRLNNAGTDIRFRLSDIDPAESFSIEFLGSRSGSSSASETIYTVTGAAGPQTVSLNTSGNTDTLATVQSVTPTAAGEILIRLEAEEGSFMYLNAVRLRTEAEGPEITFTQQPDATITDGGGALSFTALVATSEPGVLFRWQRDGEPLHDNARISGATTAALTITNAGIDDIGEYHLLATLGSTVASSSAVAGVVRSSPLGVIDADGNGTLDFFDMIRLLQAFDEVSP